MIRVGRSRSQRRGVRRWLWIGLLVAATASCSKLPAAGHPSASDRETGVPFPGGCAQFHLSPRRCAFIVQELAKRAGIDLSTAEQVLLLGDPGCGGDLVPAGQLCVRSGSVVARVRFMLPGGRSDEQSQFCSVGGQYSFLCTENPEIALNSPTLNGYHDVPCSGEPPAGCASPVPSIDPAVARDASPLRRAFLDIPIDHAGVYLEEVGAATIPNGVLTTADFSVSDLHPKDYVLTESGVTLELESEDGDSDFWNIYAHGWRPGVEHVTARLRFEVLMFDPGAVLHVRDVNVQ